MFDALLGIGGGFPPYNLPTHFGDQRWLMEAMQNAHKPRALPYRSIKPATRMSDKAVRLFQANSLVRAA